ncbi:sigma-70 family RNA polymerase sigma factor [Liquorilactobacillus mali]|uniref:ComX n=1 Tax=Liquorilactobacillus mali KCTC 3596 = DSM 20444 TaxID=1046596 RepID=J1F5Q0_9LACO|nr:sigma-70 family RNA polymerase sigma factor [Liquorilactobacillus mali]EJF02044.1 ComX [Liquorilactobacillus mali KCTC 3596 = DSM 20444]KRN09931.1 ComX [Liquorilactobacillus mali KCTC 3596 = DSM 20444]MDV7758146.1 sigma-70 family RNA polymerase sigma factor [Liquorilactobacillus mali]QFQ74065.1 sigma-70 family RNA polymerase sigma factor [Liquorilactobacillus mali]
MANSLDNKSITEQILSIRNTNDNEDFQKLFLQYRPLVLSSINRYHFRFYEIDDLLQESRIVCYQAVLAYNIDGKITFGKFYQQSLLNCFCSILRKESATKRQADRFAESFENILETQGEYYSKSAISNISPENTVIINEAVNSLPYLLSDFEYHVFSLLYFKHQSPEAIAILLKEPQNKVNRAVNRCKNKLAEELF